MTKKQPPLEELVCKHYEDVHDVEVRTRKANEQRDELKRRLCMLFGRGDYENGRRYLIELLGGLPGS